MMQTVNVQEVRTKLLRLLEQVAAGEEIVIAKAGKPIARLVPIEQPEPRKPGIAKGRLTETFFEPLPPDELDAWEP